MISVICPVYNESAFIKKLLEFYTHALPADKELILVDGNSTDDTCVIIKEYMQKRDDIRLLDNPRRIVPYALNKAIEAAKGDIIIRLDAHTDYAPDYFEKILETFKNTDADIVGGPMRIAKGNTVQNAIGYATCTAFGVGNSSFHFPDYEGYTDSVYLGAWKKSIFKTTGLFDVAFKRNQDDEFHYRAKSLDFKIYQHPDIKLYYHPRSNFSLLFSQYYQYGLYKPLVLQKIKSALSIRHLIPAGFVLYLLSLPLYFIPPFYIGLLPLLFYLLGDLFFTARANKPISEMFAIMLVYPTLHISYGLGFIKGFIKKPGKQ
ncbi:MAG TPA: glycosyltransferase family 2 protein [Bacteroidia bacterium]|jgi:succinoglycan biosynthesis protein ExoA|nr:glycosyltransferase family 2 protein [Bacteroidia bacterium]